MISVKLVLVMTADGVAFGFGAFIGLWCTAVGRGRTGFRRLSMGLDSAGE